MKKIEYQNLIAFHPGYYINAIINDSNISQNEFAKKIGTTKNVVYGLVHGKIPISYEIAKKLSDMLGTSVEVWINLQNTYDQNRLEIERQKGEMAWK